MAQEEGLQAQRYRDTLEEEGARTEGAKVINLSGVQLTTIETEVLHKGLKFCPDEHFNFGNVKIELFKFIRKLKLQKFFLTYEPKTSRKAPCFGPPVQETVTERETLLALYELSETQSEMPALPEQLSKTTKLRGKSSFTPHSNIKDNIDLFYEAVSEDIDKLGRNFTFKRKLNMEPNEMTALKSLAMNREIVIKPADKGGNIVILSKEKYEAEALRQLRDEQYYREVDMEFAQTVCTNVEENVKKWALTQLLTEEEEDYLKGLFAPGVKDGVFFPKPPEEILSAKESNPVPFLIGVNNHEYGHIINAAMNISSETYKNGLDREAVNSYFKFFSAFMGPMTEFMPLVFDEYAGDTEDPIKIRDAYFDMLGDIVFVYPSLKTAKYHRDSGLPVYFYEFQHSPSMFASLRPSFVKADHGDEIGFVLGGPFLDSGIILMGNATDEEKNLSKQMMKYWANFARNGDPNSDGLPEWPVYDDEEQYLGITLDPKIGRQLKEERFTFFSKILPEKIEAINAQKKEHTEL